MRCDLQELSQLDKIILKKAPRMAKRPLLDSLLSEIRKVASEEMLKDYKPFAKK